MQPPFCVQSWRIATEELAASAAAERSQAAQAALRRLQSSVEALLGVQDDAVRELQAAYGMDALGLSSDPVCCVERLLAKLADQVPVPSSAQKPLQRVRAAASGAAATAFAALDATLAPSDPGHAGLHWLISTSTSGLLSMLNAVDAAAPNKQNRTASRGLGAVVESLAEHLAPCLIAARSQQASAEECMRHAEALLQVLPAMAVAVRCAAADAAPPRCASGHASWAFAQHFCAYAAAASSKLCSARCSGSKQLAELHLQAMSVLRGMEASGSLAASTSCTAHSLRRADELATLDQAEVRAALERMELEAPSVLQSVLHMPMQLQYDYAGNPALLVHSMEQLSAAVQQPAVDLSFSSMLLSKALLALGESAIMSVGPAPGSASASAGMHFFVTGVTKADAGSLLLACSAAERLGSLSCGRDAMLQAAQLIGSPAAPQSLSAALHMLCSRLDAPSVPRHGTSTGGAPAPPHQQLAARLQVLQQRCLLAGIAAGQSTFDEALGAGAASVIKALKSLPASALWVQQQPKGDDSDSDSESGTGTGTGGGGSGGGPLQLELEWPHIPRCATQQATALWDVLQHQHMAAAKEAGSDSATMLPPPQVLQAVQRAEVEVALLKEGMHGLARFISNAFALYPGVLPLPLALQHYTATASAAQAYLQQPLAPGGDAARGTAAHLHLERVLDAEDWLFQQVAASAAEALHTAASDAVLADVARAAGFLKDLDQVCTDADI